MISPALSRRAWLTGAGLAACGYLAAGHAEAAPAGYVTPGGTVTPGLAPGLRSRVLTTYPDGTKDYLLAFGKGDEVFSGLTEFAEKEGLHAARLQAIGAFRSARFAWFDAARKAYREVPVNEQVEVCSLLGDIGLAGEKPQVHVHGVIGLPDGTTRGGHLLEAHAWPTLELFLTAWPKALVKKRDEETGLSLFDPTL
ncbi:MAG: DNA-binding protein [Verrucomicrobium sp.]|nr:DNA-binding protein [Verrucomicrobium sp.]